VSTSRHSALRRSTHARLRLGAARCSGVALARRTACTGGRRRYPDVLLQPQPCRRQRRHGDSKPNRTGPAIRRRVVKGRWRRHASRKNEPGAALSDRARCVQSRPKLRPVVSASSPPAATPTAPTPTPPALRARGSGRGRHRDRRDTSDAQSIGADVAHERRRDEGQNGRAACQEAQDLCHRTYLPLHAKVYRTYPLVSSGQVNNALRRSDSRIGCEVAAVAPRS
jgi:hypothetical protein